MKLVTYQRIGRVYRAETVRKISEGSEDASKGCDKAQDAEGIKAR